MMIDEDYYYDCEKKFDNLEKEWKSKKISNVYALQVLYEYKKAFIYYITNDGPTPTRAKMESLTARLDKLRDKIKYEMKIIHIIRTSEDKVIAVSDENLVKKCIERLGKDTLVATYKMKICQSEKDIDEVLSTDVEI